MLHGQSLVLCAHFPVGIEPQRSCRVSSRSACGLDILSLSNLWLQESLALLAPCQSSDTFWRHSRACHFSPSLCQTPLLMTETWLGHWPAGSETRRGGAVWRGAWASEPRGLIETPLCAFLAVSSSLATGWCLSNRLCSVVKKLLMSEVLITG